MRNEINIHNSLYLHEENLDMYTNSKSYMLVSKENKLVGTFTIYLLDYF